MKIPEKITISKRKYTLDLVEKHGMLEAKPISTLIDYNQKLQRAHDDETLSNPTIYRQLISKLL